METLELMPPVQALTLFAGDIPAKISAPQTPKGKGCKEADLDCGSRCCELSPKHGPGTSLSKTCPQQVTAIATGSTQQGPRSKLLDTQSNGSTYQQLSLGLATIEQEPFLWPTPTKSDALPCRVSIPALAREYRRLSAQVRIPTILAAWFGVYPTVQLYEEMMGLPPGWTDTSSEINPASTNENE